MRGFRLRAEDFYLFIYFGFLLLSRIILQWSVLVLVISLQRRSHLFRLGVLRVKTIRWLIDTALVISGAVLLKSELAAAEQVPVAWR